MPYYAETLTLTESYDQPKTYEIFTSACNCPLIYSCGNDAGTNSDNKNAESSELEQRVENNDDSTLSESDKYKWENTKVEFGKPIVLKSTKNIAIPIILEDIYKDKLTTEHRYFNIAIIDEFNALKKMLFDKSVVIHDLFTIENPVHEYDRYYDEGKDQIFSDDYNSLLFMEVAAFTEGKKSDMKRLYVYDLEKDVLNPLTPNHYDVKSWRIYKGISRMIIRIAADTDKNGVYDEKDTENVVMVDPNEPNELLPLFDTEALKEVKYKVLEANEVKK